MTEPEELLAAAGPERSATALLARYRGTGDREALSKAIAITRNAMGSAEPVRPEQARHAAMLGVLLRERYWLTKDPDLLSEAAVLGRTAAEALVPDPERLSYSSELGETLRVLATQNTDPGSADEAVSIARAVLRAAPDNASGSDNSSFFGRLCAALWSRSWSSMSTDEIDEAVAAGRAAVASVPADVRRTAENQLRLARSLLRRHTLAGDPEAVSEAVQLMRTAATALPPADTYFVDVQELLCQTLAVLYRLRRDPALLVESIAAGRATVAAAAADDPFRDGYLAALARGLETLGVDESDAGALEEAATIRGELVDALPAGHPGRPRRLAESALVLGAAFEVEGDLSALGRSIAALREAVSEDPSPEVLADVLDSLAHDMRLLYEKTEDADAIGEAVALRHRALMLHAEGSAEGDAQLEELKGDLTALLSTAPTSESRRALVVSQRTAIEELRDSVWYPYLLTRLNAGITDLNREHPDPDLVRAMVETSRTAAESTPEDHAESAVRHYWLALDLWELYADGGDVRDLHACVAAGRAAMAATPPDDPDFSKRAKNLAIDLSALHGETGELRLLFECVEAARAAMRAAAPDSAEFIDRCYVLTAFLATLYEWVGDVRILHEAAGVIEPLLAQAPEDHPDRASMLGMSALVKLRLYEQNGELRTLDEAIAVGRSAVGTAADAASAAPLRNDLGAALLRRYEAIGELGLLEEAVEHSRAAVRDVDAEADPDLAVGMTIGLAQAFVRLHRRTGEIALLHEAASLARDAVASVSPNHLFYGVCLNALGLATLELAIWTGDNDVLLESLRANEDAVEKIGAGHPNRVLSLANLGAGYRLRYGRTGELADLQAAVAASRETVSITAAGHPSMPLLLTNLSSSILMLSTRTGSSRLAREAVAAARAAVAASPAKHFVRPIALNALGNALESLYLYSGDLDVARELTAVRLANIEALPRGDASTTSVLVTYARSLDHVYSRTGNPAVLAQLTSVARSGLHGVPERHGSPSQLRSHLASALLQAFELSGDREALSEARELYLRIAQDPAVPIGMRVQYWSARSRTDMLAGDAESALRAAEAAVALLPQSGSRSLRRRDREVRLADVSGVGARAAAAALANDDPVRAAELLEQARGLLLREAMSMRGGPPELLGASSVLAREYEELCDVLAELEAESESGGGLPTAAVALGQVAADTGIGFRAERMLAQRRRDAADRWDALMDRIRAEPGLSDFMLPRRASRLQAEAGCAPIVLFAVSDSRCDALILTGDPARPVSAVPLTAVTADEVVRQAGRFRAALWSIQSDESSLAAQRRGERTILEILEWMWDGFADPVLTALGFHRTPGPDEAWPRVWWCPTGMLSCLPLHASGHHSDLDAGVPEPRTVLDRVVSSYTATVETLAYHGSPRARRESDARALIVSVPEADGAAGLEDVEAEVGDLTALLPGATVLAGAEATGANVRAALRRHALVHFACHGVSDWTSSQDSRLILAGSEHNTLSVAEISQLELDADLAFLSACETSDTAPRLADEGLHIASAFQLAGYRHVIGTLWPINDSAARRIAVEVYRELTAEGTRHADPDGSALALHQAVRRLRAEGCGVLTPARWAAHIHTGP